MSVRGFNTGSGVEQYDYEYLDNKPEIPTKKSDIGLGNVDNTSDLDKPISNATQTALDEKVPNDRKVNGKALSADVTLTSEDIGYDASTAYGSGTVGEKLSELNRQISESITPAIEEIETALDGKAPAIYETVSGDIASFTDGADGMPVKSLVANIEPVQDLHGYDNPWPEGGGKNKLPVTMTSGTTSSGIVQNVDSFGVITLTGATSGSIYLGVVSIVTLPAGTYTVNGMASNSYSATLQVRNGSASGTTFATDSGSGAQFTLESETAVAVIIRIPTNTTISNSIVVKPMIRLSTETDATFTPYSNICPISGHTGCTVGVAGVNWIPNNLTFTDGLRDDNGGQTESTVSHYSEPFPIKPNTTYKGSGVIRSSANPRIYFLDSNKNWISRTAQFFTDEFTFTTPENCYYIQVQCYVGVDLSEGMISTDQTAPVTPYVGNTAVTVSWETEAGTVYGGTLDVTNGVLTVDRAMVTYNGQENWSFGVHGNNYRAYISVADIDITTPDTEVGNIICNQFKTISYSVGGVSVGVASRYVVAQINFFQNIATTVTEWKANLASNPLTVVYNIATPITYTLTESEISGILTTLYGTNNIWTDVGTVDVEYPADTRLFIEQLTKPTEDDMTANANIAANKFFMIGNTLYFSTAAIAAGATILPGTNCNVVSLADALNNLNS